MLLPDYSKNLPVLEPGHQTLRFFKFWWILIFHMCWFLKKFYREMLLWPCLYLLKMLYFHIIAWRAIFKFMENENLHSHAVIYGDLNNLSWPALSPFMNLFCTWSCTFYIFCLISWHCCIVDASVYVKFTVLFLGIYTVFLKAGALEDYWVPVMTYANWNPSSCRQMIYISGFVFF